MLLFVLMRGCSSNIITPFINVSNDCNTFFLWIRFYNYFIANCNRIGRCNAFYFKNAFYSSIPTFSICCLICFRICFHFSSSWQHKGRQINRNLNSIPNLSCFFWFLEKFHSCMSLNHIFPAQCWLFFTQPAEAFSVGSSSSLHLLCKS